jgi:hypothetical protein
VALFRRKRRRFSRTVWVKEVKAFRDSGLSAEEYAGHRGINLTCPPKLVHSGCESQG